MNNSDPAFPDARDLATIKFNVTPTENTLIVEYVFGSDEYNEYVATTYNDFIKVLVNGANCALTPDGQNVTINAINDRANYPPRNGTNGASANPFLYINNDPGLDDGLIIQEVSTATHNTEMDGFTRTLSCRAPVTPGVSAAVEIGIADGGDASIDSWAFFKAHSLRSEPGDEFGDAPDTYKTLAASNGPSHTIVSGVYLGTPPVGDSDGFVDGVDDSAGNSADDASDDGVPTFPNLSVGDATYSITVNATSINGKGANIIGWIDFDNDGQFQIDEASDTLSVPAGSYETNFTLNWPIFGQPLPDIVEGSSVARIRIVNSDELTFTVNGFEGAFLSGEVEDYKLEISGPGDVTASVVTIDAIPFANIANQATYPVSGSCTAGDNNVSVTITGIAS